MKSYKKRTKQNYSWKMGGWLGLSLMVATVLYLGQVNMIATSGLAARKGALELESLQTHNHELQMAARDLESLPNLSDASQKLQLIQLQNLQYAGNTNGQVVARR